MFGGKYHVQLCVSCPLISNGHSFSDFGEQQTDKVVGYQILKSVYYSSFFSLGCQVTVVGNISKVTKGPAGSGSCVLMPSPMQFGPVP
jgi:hypothetical protein